MYMHSLYIHTYVTLLTHVHACAEKDMRLHDHGRLRDHEKVGLWADTDHVLGERFPEVARVGLLSAQQDVVHAIPVLVLHGNVIGCLALART